MNNKELAAALLEMKKRQETCICNYACCSECGCWDKSCEEEGCNILVQASEALEKASDYEKILADFSKVVNDRFQAMAEQKEKKSGWISVKDRLPGKYLNVLVHFRTGKVEIDFLVENGKFCFEGTKINEKATHWMPLPEPPEEVTP